MKKVRTSLWVPVYKEGLDPTQKSRPVFITYVVNPVGSKTLYGIKEIKDAHHGLVYSVDGVIPLNADMDQIIVAADKKQVEFAKVELKVDVTKPKPKPKPKPVEPSDPRQSVFDIP